MAELIHPGVQPEIVFRLRHPLAGPGVTPGDVLAATEWLACALEVVDSRYTGPSARLEDVVADSASAAYVVLGSRWVTPSQIPDLSLVGCSLEADGVPVTTAAGAAVLGHPAAAVARLANWIGRRGGAVGENWIVLSGGLTPAVPLVPGGHVTATFGRLGRITVRAAPTT
jgi:2-keto-4-pentenoate hydratase